MSAGLEADLRAAAAEHVADPRDIDDLVEAALARAAWRGRRGFKVCSRCRERRPAGAFSRDSSRSDGLRRYCRECDSARRV